MKKYLCIILSACLLCACKDEPDSNNGNNGGQVSLLNNAVFTTNDGDKVVVSSIGSYYSFSYDDNGYALRAGDYIIDYDDMVIYDRDYPEDRASFKLNKQGLIANIEGKYSGDDWSSSFKYTFSYDSNGHITACDFNEKEVYYEDGKKYTDTETAKVSYVWANEKITKASSNYTWEEGDSNDSGKGTSTLIPKYIEANPLRQYTIGFAEMINDEYPEFVIVGLLGKPCSHLPSSIYWSDVEDGEVESENYEYDYTFNYDGTISCEYEDGYSRSYSYRPFYQQSRSMSEVSNLIPNMSKEAKVRKHRIRDRIRSRHNRIRK